MLSLSVFYPQPGLVAVLADDQTAVRDAQREREQLQQRMLQTQKMESLGLLAGGIAHDFNNLLVGILGNVDLALARSPADSAARPLPPDGSKRRPAARRISPTRCWPTPAGAASSSSRSISRELVGRDGPRCSAPWSPRTASVRYDLADDLPPVEADATQMRQVVMNLITNASEALGERRR